MPRVRLESQSSRSAALTTGEVRTFDLARPPLLQEHLENIYFASDFVPNYDAWKAKLLIDGTIPVGMLPLLWANKGLEYNIRSLDSSI